MKPHALTIHGPVHFTECDSCGFAIVGDVQVTHAGTSWAGDGTFHVGGCPSKSDRPAPYNYGVHWKQFCQTSADDAVMEGRVECSVCTLHHEPDRIQEQVECSLQNKAGKWEPCDDIAICEVCQHDIERGLEPQLYDLVVVKKLRP